MNKETAKDYLPMVQALSEGKVIQYKYQKSDKSYAWMDLESVVDFSMPAEFYRIKPEPREIFFVEFGTGNRGPYATIEIAQQAYPRCKVKRYREVIE